MPSTTIPDTHVEGPDACLALGFSLTQPWLCQGMNPLTDIPPCFPCTVSLSDGLPFQQINIFLKVRGMRRKKIIFIF